MHITFIDTESAWDEMFHEEYRSLNPKKHQRRRVASRRAFAAAAFDIVIEAGGKTSIAGLTSWTQNSHFTDEAVASELFDHLRFRPQASVVSWGGLATDIPVLTLAAMEHELKLPPQLCANRPRRWNEPRPHCDLALEMKAQGRDWAHLSEIGLRLGLPAILFANKSRVDLPQSDEEWQQVRSHVELDTMLLALVFLSWRSAQGQIKGDWTAMAFQIIDWFISHRQPDPQIVEALWQVRQTMIDRLHTRFLRAG